MLYANSVGSALVPTTLLETPALVLTGDMEIEIVFRMYSNVTNGIMVQVAASGETLPTNVLYQVVFAAGKMRVFHEYDAGVDYTYTEPNAGTLLNRWYRWKIVRSGTQYIGYQNGVESFRTSFSRPPNTSTSAWQQQLRLGSGLFSGENIDGSIAYVSIKDATGTEVYSFGTNPSSVDPANYNGFKATMSPDPYDFSSIRPVQYRKGFTENLDPFGYAVVRPAQKVQGYFIEPTSTGNEGDKVYTPRKQPLENSWKRANSKSFT